MQIAELLKPEAILLRAPVSGKEEALRLLVTLHETAGNLTDARQFQKDMLLREQEANTALTDGIVIPHAKSAGAAEPALAVVTVENSIDCGALDGKNSDLFFMIAAPEFGYDLHIEALSALSRLLLDHTFCDKLREAPTARAFVELIRERESEEKPPVQESLPVPHKILAVTACPNGLAHTYMAAQALETAAAQRGISLKVETNGARGVERVLTQEEIEQAECVIVAADRAVDMARFKGKKVLTLGTARAIRNADELLNIALKGNAPVYGVSGGFRKRLLSDGENGVREAWIHVPYRHLMSGVSHMLPFVVGGGFLIALSYLLDTHAVDLTRLGMSTSLTSFFYYLGYAAFRFMLPVLSGFIAYSIAGWPGLTTGFVGGFLANYGVTLEKLQGDVSAGFLGAMLAGFVAGYLVLGIRWLLRWIPAQMSSLSVVILLPVLSLLGIGIVMMTVNPVMSYVNSKFTTLLYGMDGSGAMTLGALLGAMMAVDMGGPLNKAAYVFGTAAMAAGEYSVMAAVMLGGMVPPLVTALSSFCYRSGYTEQERKNGLANFLLGACFITEGAIPFAAADPLRVIPSCVAGAALAGGLSMEFNCTLLAPHGGLLVFPLVENLSGYLISLGAGLLLGTVILTVLKWQKKRYGFQAENKS